MRRLALYSDIHGNVAALDAVYADMDVQGVTERYCLGDLVGYGPAPAEVIARVRASGDSVIRGNYDDGVGKGKGECGCYYSTPEARADGEASYAWTEGALDDRERDYLAGLGREVRFEAEGVRVLLTHASPRRLNEYLLLDRPDSNLAKLAEAADADVICFGHVHLPYHRVVALPGGKPAHFVSDGSVGKPKDGDPRACWAELLLGTAEEIEPYASRDAQAGPVSDDAWVAALFHRVPYDIEAVAADVLAAGLPSRLADALRKG